MAYKGKYKPQNPKKYKGDPTNIVWRSLWELKFCRYVDTHPDFVEWSSEEVIVPYLSPVDNKKHRYFPDFIVKKKNKDGTHSTFMIEIKPHGQTVEPVFGSKGSTQKNGKPTRKFIKEATTYEINKSKWIAARALCESRGWKFMIMTEYELGIRKRK